jgi:hypothetical protein
MLLQTSALKPLRKLAAALGGGDQEHRGEERGSMSRDPEEATHVRITPSVGVNPGEDSDIVGEKASE